MQPNQRRIRLITIKPRREKLFKTPCDQEVPHNASVLENEVNHLGFFRTVTKPLNVQI